MPMATAEPLVRRCGDRLVTRVVRGGSWNNNHQNVRCAYRNRNNPNNRNDNNGFRVVAHGFHLRILRRLRLAQREPEAGAAGSWPCGLHLSGSSQLLGGGWLPGAYHRGLHPGLVPPQDRSGAGPAQFLPRKKPPRFRDGFLVSGWGTGIRTPTA